MYEVATATKTIYTTNDEKDAMFKAYAATRFYHYVEVKKVITTAPWYAKSVKIFTR